MKSNPPVRLITSEDLANSNIDSERIPQIAHFLAGITFDPVISAYVVAAGSEQHVMAGLLGIKVSEIGKYAS